MAGRTTSVATLLTLAVVAPVHAQDPTEDSLSRPHLTLRDVIAMTLARSIDVTHARLDVAAQQSALVQASARFDPTLRASVNRTQTQTPLFGASTDPTNSRATQLGYELGVDWLLPLGVTLSPAVSFSRTDVSTSSDIQNTGIASLTTALPLLRDRGGGSLRASLRAASVGLAATTSDAENAQRVAVRQAITAYWSYVAARERLAVLRDAQVRATTLVEQTKTLIAADERPAVDSLTVLAHAVAAAAAQLNGENAVTTAEYALAVAMGLPPAEVTIFAASVDSFPPLATATAMAAWPSDSALVVYALQRRSDLSAARYRRQAIHYVVRGAANDARTRFDVVLGLAYTGIGVGGNASRLLAPFNRDRGGFHFEVGLALDNPLGRSAARAEWQQRLAQEEQAALASSDLERTITLAVRSSVQTLRRTSEQTRLSYEALQLFNAAVEGERQKYQLGTATLFDVILATDNLTSARLAWINTQQQYATAVAELLAQLGAPLGESGCAGHIGVATVLSTEICPP